MLRTLGTTAVLAATLTLAACGSDDAGAAGDDAPTQSKADFIRQADAICKTSNDRIAAAGEKALAGEPSEADYLAYVTETLLPEVEGQASALRALPAPDEGADDVDAMLDALEADLAQAQAEPRSVLSDEDGFAEANELAKAYGFQECGAEE